MTDGIKSFELIEEDNTLIKEIEKSNVYSNSFQRCFLQ